MKHSIAKTSTVALLLLITVPALAQNNINGSVNYIKTPEEVFTYDTDLYDEDYYNSGMDVIDEVDREVFSYDTDLYDRSYYDDDGSVDILADPSDVYELDGNTRIISDDGDDIIMINPDVEISE